MLIRFLAIAFLGLTLQDVELVDGPYRRLHENGQLAAEGNIAGGVPDGPWGTFYSDGEPRTQGEYKEGRRTGAWEFFHPGGGLAASGRYRLGMRDRKWVYLTPAGEKLEGDSGLYRTESELYENRQKRFMVETLNDKRHGRWISWWEHGGLQLEGEYREGLRHGPWTFWHMDGSLEPELVTGYYLAGVRVPTPPDAEPDPFGIPEELPRSEPPSIDLSRLPRLRRPPGVKLSQRVTHKEWIVRLLDDPDELERAKAEQLLLQYSRAAVPDLLNRFAELDLDDDGDLERARKLNNLLRGVCKGRGFEWSGAPADRERDRRTLLRWFSFWGISGPDDVWWLRLASNNVPAELLSALTVDGLLPARRAPAPALTAEQAAARPLELPARRSDLFRARARARHSKQIGAAIESALRWLAAHQSLDGAWDCDAFDMQCARRGEPECDGPGMQGHDVGATALALLAFLADGNTSEAGDYPEVVLAAVRWLVAQQNPETGLIGERSVHAYLYGHAIATLALAEALQFTDSQRLRRSVQQAVDLILAARNPLMAWRYTVPSNGDNDTSITGWMVHALHAAEAAGLPVHAEAYAGASKWLASVTQEDVGRVGYIAKGGLSARVRTINDHFPPERGETMTAVGLFTEFLLGQTPRTNPMLSKQAELLLRKPPNWAPADFDCDMYYWYHGTNAMLRMGGTYWNRWHAALEAALLPSQQDDDCLAGSWDPVGPWGYAGGRVYSTALLALCLQAESRYAR